MVMMKTYACLLVLVLHVSAQDPRPKEQVVRSDEECAQPQKRINLPRCNWHYIAYFPRIFRSGVTENVNFATHGFPNNVELTIKVQDRSGRDITQAKKIVQPGKLVNVPVTIPHDAPEFVNVLLDGFGSYSETKQWVFKNESKNIRVEKLGLSILIQTDRPIYKPGQLIRSRVIVIDSKLKPYNGMLDSVVIENPSGATMRMWKNVALEEGFASFELKTSVKPVLGTWKIKAKTKTYEKTLNIIVKKYVLPKFQVTMTPPSFVTEMMKSTTAEICAKYSYGKKVYGKMNATICLEKSLGYHYRYRGRKSPPVCITVNKKIHGCTTVNINFVEMKNMFAAIKISRYSLPIHYLSIHASVHEKATGVLLSSSKFRKELKDKDVELSVESKDVFKPGFPLSVKLHAKRPDSTPVKSVDVKLKVTCSGITEPLMAERTIRIANGVQEVKLPIIPFSAKNVRVNIKYMREKLHNTENEWRRTSEGSLTIKPWYSPSHSYLDVQTVQKPVKIGDRMEVTVGYTSVDTKPIERKISYSMMCGGNLVASDTFTTTFIAAVPRSSGTAMPATTTATSTDTISGTKVTPKIPYWWWYDGPTATRPPLPYQFSTGKFKFMVPITRDMLPSCRMVVYYIRQEEVIADETSINVMNELENQVTMQFNKKEVRPGQSAKLIVTGASSSRIAVAAIDKSIHFLAKGNDIKQKQLVDIREKLTISPGSVNDWERCPRSWGGRNRRDIRWGGDGSGFVDSQKAFANIGAMVLSSMRIDVRPCDKGSGLIVPMWRREYEEPLDNIGPPGVKGAKPEKPLPEKLAPKSVRVRTEFPETWLWTDERLPVNGSRVFDVRVPDTITTWYASGFGLSKSAGLGIANPTEIRVFQPFFISLTLPYSVIRGEDVTIPAAIFSYLEGNCMTVKVSLAFSVDYQMIAGPSAKTCLCPSRTATVLFRIKPKKLGHINVRVSAETMSVNVCSGNKPFTSNVNTADILVKKLLVEAEGTKEEYTRSTFFCPANEPERQFTTTLKLALPENLVPGSLFARVEAMGDIMGSSLSNVDELLSMPYGCGEQNMLKFAPNIFIMNYLNNTNQVNKRITTKALDYMRTGYQRELTYKHNDGSYSAFGKRDKEGSTWLSAFVLKSYAQARPWIDVDEKEIKATADWLQKTQGADGCFPKIGHLHNKAMQGGVKTPATLSAYVLISMLEAGYKPNSTPIMSGARCVMNVFRSFKDSPQGADSYSLSIMAYLFAKLKYRREYDLAVRYLDGKAVNKDGMVYWQEKKEKDTKPKPWYYKARSTDIEQTAYVLLAKLAGEGKRAISKVVPIVRWLSKQRNSLGGWSSTQDTVLAMQALAEFAELTFSPNANMQVSVQAGRFGHNFVINAEKKIVLQRVENVPVPSSLQVRGRGEGCALIQANVKYNVQKVVSKSTFAVNVNIQSISNTLNRRRSCRSQNLKVCTSWLGEGEESNMAIIEVQMISGFTADEGQFEEILKADKLNLKDIEVKEKSVIFYIRKVTKKDQCVTFRVDQTNSVREAKPAPIKVYDYYDTEKSATVMYQFTRRHCLG